MAGTYIDVAIRIENQVEVDGVGERPCGGRRGRDGAAHGDGIAVEGEVACLAGAAVVGEVNGSESRVGGEVVVRRRLRRAVEGESSVGDRGDTANPVGGIAPSVVARGVATPSLSVGGGENGEQHDAGGQGKQRAAER